MTSYLARALKQTYGRVEYKSAFRESSRGCGVFWTNPGFSQAQDAKSRLRRNCWNKVCFVDWQFQRPTEKGGADRMQVSKIALLSAFDVRALFVRQPECIGNT